MKRKQITPKDLRVIKRTFESPQGKQCLQLLNNLFYNVVSFSPDNQAVTAFNEGRRDLVQFINNCVVFDSEHVDSTEEE